MRLSPIVVKLRAANTRFGSRVAGAAEIEDIFQNTIQADTAFVVQISEDTPSNEYDSGINQTVIEQFCIVVALANDQTQRDKTGLTAYDTLYTVRSQIFKALLGWIMPGSEYLTCYRGGRLLGFDRSYLWYQYIFETKFRLTDNDGVNLEDADLFNTAYIQYELAPSVNLPYEGGLPVSLFEVDSTQQIDLTTDPDAGAFSKAFNEAFDVNMV